MAEQKKQKAFSSTELMPQAEMLEIRKSNKSLNIGVPKEISYQENRISLVPNAVRLLMKHGHKVIIESNAGKAAHFYDNQYSEAGATIAHSANEVYKEADIILKVGHPDEKELAMMKHRQILISTLHLPTQKADFFKSLINSKILGIAFDFIKDRTQTLPVLRSMSEIAGNTAILIASEYMSHPKLGKGNMLGCLSGSAPTEVLILGAGTVAEYAARAAIGLGAQVKIFDNNIYKLRRLQYNMNARLFTSVIQPEVLLKALKTADVVIGAVYAYEGRTPWIISEEMVMQMKPCSVIIDVSIDQGGCIETSIPTNHTNPVFVKHDVIHYCVPNIASRVPRTASYALSNIFAPILLNAGEAGGIENLIKTDTGFMQGVYVYNGIITNKNVGETFNLPFQNIELLMAAYR